ncbi:MAG: oligosaccharide flippase family protein [Oscillospiraceae bacterium]|nr:oligosaccharide flippase family protein [Oscillospiraceae bacterium]
MKKVSFLLKNTLLITSVSLLMRSVSLFFQTRVTGMIGAEGMGLLQLVMSVQVLAITVATSGIRYSSTRLISEELGLKRAGPARLVMRRCFLYALFFGLLSCFALFFFADGLSVFAGDARVAPALRLLAPGMPFLAVNSVFCGYFSAVRTPWKLSAVQLLEQLVGMAAVFICLPLAKDLGIARACAVIAGCFSLSDLVSFSAALILFMFGRPRASVRGSSSRGVSARLVKTSLPIALSSYARTTLSTLQHVMVPSALRRSGASASSALSLYGTVHGMVFPVITFPQTFFYSLSELLIPELTTAQVRGDRLRSERIAGRVISCALILAVGSSLFFFLFGPRLGEMLYKGQNTGEYIRVMAPLAAVMYLDTVTDGMLKGLGLQLDSMYINIADAAVSLVLINTLIPLAGIKAYIGVVFFSECFNFLLSFARLSRAVRIRLNIKAL